MTPPAATQELVEVPSRAEPPAPPAAPPETVAPVSRPIPRQPESDPEPRRSGARRAGRGLWASFKFLVLLAVVGALVIAAIVGWPYVRDRLYEDVEANTARIEGLDSELATANATIANLQSQLDALGQRQDEVPTRLDDLDARQDELAGDLTETGRSLADLDQRVSGLDNRAGTLDERVTGLGETTASLTGEVSNERLVGRSTELLSRARLFLYQANYGLAASDIAAAQNLLVTVDPKAGGIDPEVHVIVTERLAVALGALPDRPVLAADELDIAWQMLVADRADLIVAPIVASNPPVPAADDAESDDVSDGAAADADADTATP